MSVTPLRLAKSQSSLSDQGDFGEFPHPCSRIVKELHLLAAAGWTLTSVSRQRGIRCDKRHPSVGLLATEARVCTRAGRILPRPRRENDRAVTAEAPY